MRAFTLAGLALFALAFTVEAGDCRRAGAAFAVDGGGCYDEGGGGVVGLAPATPAYYAAPVVVRQAGYANYGQQFRGDFAYGQQRAFRAQQFQGGYHAAAPVVVVQQQRQFVRARAVDGGAGLDRQIGLLNVNRGGAGSVRQFGLINIRR